jgi:hypothetical protein
VFALLAKKSHAIKQPLGPLGGDAESRAQPGVFLFERGHSLFGKQVALASRGLERLHTTFGLNGSPSEAGELVPEMADELLQLFERGNARMVSFAV